jgi:hypothetical protein
MVSIALQQLPAKPDLGAELASLKKEIPEGSARQATGFGTGSFYFDIPGAGTQLHALFGERQHLMVSILGFGEGAVPGGIAERIARRAISRGGY